MTGLKKIKISSGLVYDPSRNIKGDKADIYISGGRISEPFTDADITIDAEERPVLAGGIDPFCHAATPGLQFLRMGNKILSPEETGKNYARAGYVHIHQPFMTLLTAGEVQHSLKKIPYLDKSAWAAMDLRDMGKYVKGNNPNELAVLSKALAKITGAAGLMVPFPFLKHKQRHYMHMNISQKKFFEFFTGIAEDSLFPLGLWGQPGLFDIEMPNPERYHISEINRALSSPEDVQKAAEYLDAGGSASLALNSGSDTLDISPLQDAQSGSFTFDLGLNYPLSYKISEGENIPVHAWSLLSLKKPGWKLSISLNGPSTSFLKNSSDIASYLLNISSRPGAIKEALKDTEFNLEDYAELTRYQPAQALGINDAGTLRTGARANIVIYDIQKNSSPEEIQSAFSDCWLLVKDGTIVRKEGDFTENTPKTKIFSKDIDVDIGPLTMSDLLQRPTIRWENLIVNKQELQPDGE